MKKINLLLLFFVTVINVSAQMTLEIPKVIPVSPEASSVAKYVSYPVNNSTGVPSIVIPLYEITSGDIVLPLALSYHASGLKPNEPSGWVGNGWTLTGIPSVMRTIKGLPDDQMSTNDLGGYLYNDQAARNDRPDYFRKVVDEQLCDEEPDHFSYSLLNSSGSFFLSTKYFNTIQLNSNYRYTTQPITKDRIITPPMKTKIVDLSMLDAEGYRYDFGGGNVEMTGFYVTQWFPYTIQSLKTSSALSLEFNNTAPYISSGWFTTHDYAIVEDELSNFLSVPRLTTQSGSAKTVRAFGYPDDNNNNISFDPLYYNISSRYPQGHQVTQKRVSKIMFNHGYVLFHQDGKGNLRLIEVKDNENKVVRSIELVVSLYSPYTEHTKLESVKIYAGKDSEAKTYSFDYESKSSMPALSTKAIDHWGYYNGNGYGNAVHIGEVTASNNGKRYTDIVGGRDRHSSEHFMKVGVLTDIYSPEGVHTQFTFEGNRYGTRYKNEHNELEEHVTICGGLRIQTIKESNKQNVIIKTRKFKYAFFTASDMSSDVGTYIYGWGVPKHRITIDDYCYSQTITKHNAANGGTSTSRVRTYGSYPRSNITYNNGSSVLYNYVEEHTSARDINQLTKYYYNTPHWEAYSISLAHFPENYRENIPFIDKLYKTKRSDATKPFDINYRSDHEYGLLARLEKYSEGRLVSRNDYTYSSVFPLPYDSQKIPLRVSSRKIYKTTVVQTSDELYRKNNEEYSFFDEYLSGAQFVLTKEVQRNFFSSGGETSMTKEHTHGSYVHLHPIQTTTTYKNQNGNDVEKFIYPEQVYLADKTSESESLLKANLIKEPLEYHYTTKSHETIDYKYIYGGGLRPSSILYKPSRETDVYREYASFSYGYNLNEVVGATQVPTSYLWGYNNQYPILKAENVSHSQIVAALGTSWVAGMIAKSKPSDDDLKKIDDLRSKFPNGMITTYKYKPLYGVERITSPNGVQSHFNYDSFGRLKTIKDNENYVVSEYRYKHAFPNNDSGTLSPMPAIYANLAQYAGNLYKRGQEINFEIFTGGGSGSFSYQWSIVEYDLSRNIEGKVYSLSSTNSSTKVKMDYPVANYRLKCKIRDLVTLEEFEAMAYFYLHLS